VATFGHREGLAAALAIAACAAGAAPAAAHAAKRPDLTVDSLAVVGGSSTPGGVIRVLDTTANHGHGRAKKSATAVYLSKDARLGATDRLLARRRLGKLAAGKSSHGVRSAKVPQGTPAGSYSLLACADSRHRVSEKSETNNCKAIHVAISSPGKPDAGGPGGPPPGGGKPGGTPGDDGKLAYLTLSPSNGSLQVMPSLGPTAGYLSLTGQTMIYEVRGFDSKGHALGDFTDAATLTISPEGSCLAPTCTISTLGAHTVTATVGDAHGTATLTGAAPKMVCRGEYYDIDGSPQNGCERAQPSTGHTTSDSSRLLGAKTCNDTVSKTTFSGTILSDTREHTTPTVPGFDPAVGSAPEWYRIQALGTIGPACVNDLRATITTTGGSSAKCYRLWVGFAGDPKLYNGGFYVSYSQDVSGNGSAVLDGQAFSYDSGTIGYFEVVRTCAAAPAAVSYTVTFHL
jgi:CARDB